MRPRCSRSRSPSARKKKSNSPRSAVCARCTKESNSIWLPDSGSDHTVVLLTPGKWAARWIGLWSFPCLTAMVLLSSAPSRCAVIAPPLGQQLVAAQPVRMAVRDGRDDQLVGLGHALQGLQHRRDFIGVTDELCCGTVLYRRELLVRQRI